MLLANFSWKLSRNFMQEKLANSTYPNNYYFCNTDMDFKHCVLWNLYRIFHSKISFHQPLKMILRQTNCKKRFPAWQKRKKSCLGKDEKLCHKNKIKMHSISWHPMKKWHLKLQYHAAIGKISVYKHCFCYSNVPTTGTKDPLFGWLIRLWLAH